MILRKCDEITIGVSLQAKLDNMTDMIGFVDDDILHTWSMMVREAVIKFENIQMSHCENTTVLNQIIEAMDGCTQTNHKDKIRFNAGKSIASGTAFGVGLATGGIGVLPMALAMSLGMLGASGNRLRREMKYDKKMMTAQEIINAIFTSESIDIREYIEKVLCIVEFIKKLSDAFPQHLQMLESNCPLLREDYMKEVALCAGGLTALSLITSHPEAVAHVTDTAMNLLPSGAENGAMMELLSGVVPDLVPGVGVLLVGSGLVKAIKDPEESGNEIRANNVDIMKRRTEIFEKLEELVIGLSTFDIHDYTYCGKRSFSLIC